MRGGTPGGKLGGALLVTGLDDTDADDAAEVTDAVAEPALSPRADGTLILPLANELDVVVVVEVRELSGPTELLLWSN